VPRGVDRADAKAALMKALYNEHAAGLWRYAFRLTGDASQAEDVVQETLLRARQHPEVVGDAERSARAWLFTVARHLRPSRAPIGRNAKWRQVIGSTLRPPRYSPSPRVSVPGYLMAAGDGVT
jgi:RNA polymerase sigma-70 factor, ECF subfamily